MGRGSLPSSSSGGGPGSEDFVRLLELVVMQVIALFPIVGLTVLLGVWYRLWHTAWLHARSLLLLLSELGLNADSCYMYAVPRACSS